MKKYFVILGLLCCFSVGEAQIKGVKSVARIPKQLGGIRAARSGEKPWEVFDRDNPLKRTRTNETALVPEETPAQLRKDYAQLTPKEQTVIRQTEEYYEELWENYPTWFEENKTYIITTTQTRNAFDTLNRAIQSGRA